MRISHGPDAGFRVEARVKSDHVAGVLQPPEGRRIMFVRARLAHQAASSIIKQTLREMEVPSTRNADLFGISGPDFSKMTRGLFDRAPR